MMQEIYAYGIASLAAVGILAFGTVGAALIFLDQLLSE